MIKIEKQLPCFDTFAQLLGYTPGTSLFFDIETTGFSPSSTSLYLIGVVSADSDGKAWRLTQWMAEHRQEEPLILTEFLRFLESYDTLIHFNGTTFDLPYLGEKLKHYGMVNPFSEKKSLDLYHIFRPLKNLLKLTRMSQQTLQSFLGQKRADPLNGKALIPIWRQYADKPDPAAADLLFLHNQEDLCGMTSLLCLSAYLALADGKISLRSCRLQGDFAVLTLQLEYPLPQNIQADCLVRPDGASSGRRNSSAADGSGRHLPDARYILTTDFTDAALKIPVFCGELLHFLPNYRDYYYLPLERQAVHRSVASFVDREHRVPAKRSNCCIRKNGIFLPQPAGLITPLFVPFYRSKDLYFEYTENYESHPGLLENYAKAVLGSFPGGR